MARKIFLIALLLCFSSCGMPSTAPSPNVGSYPADATDKIQSGALIVDVRSPEEFATGHIPNAVNIPHTEIESRLREFGSDSARDIVLYCKSGRRAGLAAEILRKNGYTKVLNAGGYEELKEAQEVAKHSL